MVQPCYPRLSRTGRTFSGSSFPLYNSPHNFSTSDDSLSRCENRTKYTYDSAGRRASVTDPLSN
ncbi:hypothetical protein ACFLQR_02440, partial [Verrucomicrobiota bacterium]